MALRVQPGGDRVRDAIEKEGQEEEEEGRGESDSEDVGEEEVQQGRTPPGLALLRLSSRGGGGGREDGARRGSRGGPCSPYTSAAGLAEVGGEGHDRGRKYRLTLAGYYRSAADLNLRSSTYGTKRNRNRLLG